MVSLLSGDKDLSEGISRVDEYINKFLHTDQETEAMDSVFGSMRNTRGKMIRPLFLLLTARFGPDYGAMRERLCKLGAFVEIVHMASLIHDDIIDDSPLRRGRPTVQQQFGKDVAVYTGDFMISRVMRHLAEEQMLHEVAVMGQTVEEMCRGELGQMTYRWNTETTVDAYLRNIYGKSVALFVGAARLGGEDSGCSPDIVSRLTAIGEHLGYIYQIRDDVLDFISDQQQEGKPVNRDFADGIYTLPVIYALGQPEYTVRLREIAGTKYSDPDYAAVMKEMREIVLQSGGIDFSRQQLENHAAQARQQIDALGGHDAGQSLTRLIDYLLDLGDT